MLPEPSCTLTIPSLYDGVELECRIYHPDATHSLSASGRAWQKRGAVVAHPYAPLGGSFDDPVVDLVAAQLFEHDFVIGTFNFRGAGKSKGRTSWTAAPEQQDYASVVGLLVYYLEHLEPGHYAPSPALSSPGSSHLLSPVPSAIPSPRQAATTLILAGYSYGSLVAAHLPSLSSILAPFSRTEEGSSAAEIRLRALHLASAWNEEHQARRRHVHSSALHGGEFEAGSRRSRESSRRSVEFLRRSVDRSREKLGLSPRRPAAEGPPAALKEMELAPLESGFLLVSPLLPPVASFLTMFARHGLLHRHSHKQEHKEEETSRLASGPTFVVYGDDDLFTSAKKLQRWTTELKERPGSRVQTVEIPDAGHFWHAQDAQRMLADAIRVWVRSLTT